MGMQGGMKGLNKYNIGNGALLVSSLFIALPMSYLFSFSWGFGIHGLWYASLFKGPLQIIFLAFYLYFMIDWEAYAKKVFQSMSKKTDFLVREDGELEIQEILER
mmetsp:Transcript_28138/g.27142  ORF Transcript_28138/g.27142 Transcript_28138/m.27142 type:complete len:105 (+) Transcript_28138:1125-1439(+)